MVTNRPPKNLEKYSKRMLRDGLKTRLIGQEKPIDAIIPYVTLYGAGINLPRRPVGAFLLMGPTGTGKTRTVEALADMLHGDETKVLRLDCGEYHGDHEVAKLIGAPPGYLGHRETNGLLTQQKLAEVTSEDCGLSLVLFDEIEKGAPSLLRMLLGILDRASLKLGDNTTTNFDKTLFFFTSNLGAKQMQNILNPDFGFVPPAGDIVVPESKLSAAGLTAAKKKFTPEFMNRIDEILTYMPLSPESIQSILEISLKKLRSVVESQTVEKFVFVVTDSAKEWLIKNGFSKTYGARPLNQLLQRKIMNPLAEMIVNHEIPRSGIVRAAVKDDDLVMEDVTMVAPQGEIQVV